MDPDGSPYRRKTRKGSIPRVPLTPYPSARVRKEGFKATEALNPKLLMLPGSRCSMAAPPPPPPAEGVYNTEALRADWKLGASDDLGLGSQV